MTTASGKFGKAFNGKSPMLQGHWRLDDITGEIAPDSSGKNRWMQSDSPLSANFQSINGRALFDGTLDRLLLYNGAFLEYLQIADFIGGNSASYIIALRLNMPSFPSTQTVFGNITRQTIVEGSRSGIDIEISTVGKVQQRWSPSGADVEQFMISTSNLSVDTDYHIVFGFDPVNTRMFQYWNGALEKEVTSLAGYTDPATEVLDFPCMAISRRGNAGGGGGLFSGQLWDVQFYRTHKTDLSLAAFQALCVQVATLPEFEVLSNEDWI